jgi:hypothetical protein
MTDAKTSNLASPSVIPNRRAILKGAGLLGASAALLA